MWLVALLTPKICTKIEKVNKDINININVNMNIKININILIDILNILYVQMKNKIRKC